MAVSDEFLLAEAENDLAREMVRIQKLDDERQKAEVRATEFRAVVAWLRRRNGISDIDPSPAKLNVARHGSKADTIVAATIEAIKSAGRSLSIAEIKHFLDENDIVISAENPKARLAGYLTRDDRVTFKQGFGWSTHTISNEEPAEAGSQSNVGTVAERSIAPDLKSGGEGPQKFAPVGSNPTGSAPIHRNMSTLLTGTTAPAAPINPTIPPFMRR